MWKYNKNDNKNHSLGMVKVKIDSAGITDRSMGISQIMDFKNISYFKVRLSLDKAEGNMYGAHRALGIIANERSAL